MTTSPITPNAAQRRWIDAVRAIADVEALSYVANEDGTLSVEATSVVEPTEPETMFWILGRDGKATIL